MSSGSAAGRDTGGGTTAAVLEFVCLFTHDLKRKQKRWQDGRLKYHTFNKRVMVYDERGNFVGDMHWHRDWDFDEGEEVELERGSVIVQVAECVGQRDQDLSELVDKRVKEKEERQAKAAARPSIYGPGNRASPLSRAPAPQDHFQTRHRPLHQVIGTPTGHHGRALVPNESPFEQRQRANETPGGGSDTRPAKRRRQDITPPSKMGYAQSLFGAPLNLSAVPMSSVPLRRPTTARSQPRLQSSPPEPEGSGRHRDTQASLKLGGEKDTPASTFGSQDTVDLPSHNPTNHDRGKAAANAKVPARANGRGSSNHFAGIGTTTQTQERGNQGSPLPAAATPQAHERGPPPPAQRLSINNSATGFTVGGIRRPREVILLDDDSDTTQEPPKAAQPKEKPPRKKKDAVPSAKSRISFDTHGRPEPKRKEKPSRPPSPLREATPNVSVRPTTTPAVVDEPPQEKTEIRIKPRQKRGLLVALEPPRKTKRPKETKTPGEEDAAEKRDNSASELFTPEPPVAPSTAPARKKSPAVEDDDPFASSPVVKAAIVENNKSPTTKPQRRRRKGSIALSECDSSDPNKGSESTNKRPKPRNAVYDMPEDTDDELENTHPPPSLLASFSDSDRWEPPVEKGSGRPKQVAKPQEPEPDSDGSSVDLTLITRTRGAKQTRGSPSKPGKEVLDALQTKRGCLPRQDSSDEEIPQVPVGPRLARLSRKSVKSREVIGFIPSSSPVAEQTHVPMLHRDNLPFDGIVSTLGNLTAAPRPVPVSSRSASAVGERTAPVVPDDVIGMEDTSSASAERQSAVITTRATGSGISSPQRQISLPGARHHESPGNCIEQDAMGDRGLSSVADHPGRAGMARQRSVVIAAGSDRIGGEISAAPATGPGNAIRHEEEQPPDAGTRAFPNKEGNGDDVQALLREARGPPDLQSKPRETVHSLEERSLVEGNCSRGTAGQEREAAGPKGPPPRIANPASRGRKAALKSDAAGQVPQNILPPPDPMPTRFSMRLAPEARRDSAGNERPKRKMTFPGFTSARVGGPWSREAHDLLESGRPGST
ncbi:hypothetical protein OQA88_4532 [Cercophora sp. LCS_1]